jgi:hypothetical protein
MPNADGKQTPKKTHEPQIIPIAEIVSALHGVQITMPGHVTKRKKKFSLTVNASFSGSTGNIVIKIIPAAGWRRPIELTVKYVSIKRAHGQALKHRIIFNDKGIVTLHNVGRGDYVLQVF